MEAQEATPGSQSQESCVLDLPSACDIRDYVLQRSRQEPDSETFSSVEFHSFPCSSDVDPESARSCICEETGTYSFLPPACTF
ncbi:shieldin complex subunit 1 isoform X3 [Lepus europaeus]|uniref:shieldin complex subunit 1 isoform X3 n=1 Tax=Lepus europaeus TaxID=9983 RepID=UPI002B47C729|nr:shieldin complex subunit 1 isoform X3 [Lepus europaeus]